MVLADDGYASEKNRAPLKGKGYTDGIIDKTTRNKRLLLAQIIVSKLISFVRYKVKRSIERLKRDLASPVCDTQG